jgi:isopentenyl diphosphate isomerase/L-lactate dehydrogenase-like FMN-dependent dehydrogenase
VGGELEIVLDGGVRRGADVVRAVALGARVVMIGRAGLWGLAASGEAGVTNVLGILRDGLRETLTALAVDDVADLGPEHLLVPDGFSPRISELA